MKAIVKDNPGIGLNIVDVQHPSLGCDDVLIKVHYGAICGTDLHIYQWDEWSSNRMNLPTIIGHEFSGEIIDVGKSVDRSRIGQKVASESHLVCGRCKQCLLGQAHVCSHTQILGVDTNGGFSEFVAIPSENARVIPEGLSLKTASMLDAVGNGVHTLSGINLDGKSVLITGLGPIGLFSVAIAKSLGASEIIGIEVSPYRTKLAEKIGITAVLHPDRDGLDKELKEFSKTGFDVCLEMSGHSNSLETITKHCRAGGDIRLLGVYARNNQNIDLNHWIMSGYQVKCVIGRELWNTWDTIDMLFSKKGLNLDDLITHTYSYQEYDRAMQLLAKGDAGKIVLDFRELS